MLKRDRLIPFFKDNKLICFIAFYICDDESKYISSDPWQILDDKPDGKICYINQLLTSKSPNNPKLSYEIWHRFKIYIKNSFPSVQYICWRRWDKKTEAIKTCKKEIGNIIDKKLNICKDICKAYCCNVLTLMLKNNRTPEEENEVQLILAHNGTHFKEKDGVQYIEIESRCKFLTMDNECSIYDKRFNTCRKYECEKLKKEMEKCPD